MHGHLARLSWRTRPPAHATHRAASRTQFENMLGGEQIRDFRCFYNTEQQKFYSVVLLGRCVAYGGRASRTR